MKSSIITILLVIALISGICVYSNLKTKNITDTYLDLTKQIEQLVNAKQYDAITPVLAQMKQKWKADCESFQFISYHQDTNTVDSYLLMLEAGLESDDKVVILLATHELTESFENIYQREKISLVNIF